MTVAFDYFKGFTSVEAGESYQKRHTKIHHGERSQNVTRIYSLVHIVAESYQW